MAENGTTMAVSSIDREAGVAYSGDHSLANVSRGRAVEETRSRWRAR
jgi:hypothetical protein